MAQSCLCRQQRGTLRFGIAFGGLLWWYGAVLPNPLRCETTKSKYLALQRNLMPIQGDTVCGPRCVRLILRWYGREEKLIDLVRELQWPRFEEGSTLAALAQSLEVRGIHTMPLALHSGQAIEWPQPAILHLRSKLFGSALSTSEDVGDRSERDTPESGHFVVLLPSSGAKLQIWDGLRGEVSIAPTDIWQHWSGAVLLTSAEIIERENALSCVVEADGRQTRLSCIVLTFATVVVLGIGFHKLRGRVAHGRNLKE